MKNNSRKGYQGVFKRECKYCKESFIPKGKFQKVCFNCASKHTKSRLQRKSICKHCKKLFPKILAHDRVCLKCHSKGLRKSWRDRLEVGVD